METINWAFRWSHRWAKILAASPFESPNFARALVHCMNLNSEIKRAAKELARAKV